MRCASIRGFAVALAGAAPLMCFGDASVVQAQSLRLRATIPFDFHVGTENLPAGMYDLELIAGSVIRMVTEKGRVVTASGTMPVYNPSDRAGSKLVFNRYGNDHFLSEAYWSGYSSGRSLFKSPAEVELARDTARKRVVESVVGP